MLDPDTVVVYKAKNTSEEGCGLVQDTDERFGTKRPVVQRRAVAPFERPEPEILAHVAIGFDVPERRVCPTMIQFSIQSALRCASGRSQSARVQQVL